MSNLNYKQAVNVERRKWDKEAYEKKAAARKKQELEDELAADSSRGVGLPPPEDNSSNKPEFRPAAPGAAGPEGSKRAFLEARKGRVEGIDDQVGTSVMLSVDDAAGGAKTNADVVKKTGVGWHCSVCDCFLKDSHTYLDHINGRKHQRKLGYSMRVKRSTESDLMSRLNSLQKKKDESKEEDIAIDYDTLVERKDEEEKRRKEERKRKRKERKKLQKEKEHTPPEEAQDEKEEEKEDEVPDGGIHPDMASMMGFSGFGGSSKN